MRPAARTRLRADEPLTPFSRRSAAASRTERPVCRRYARAAALRLGTTRFLGSLLLRVLCRVSLGVHAHGGGRGQRPFLLVARHLAVQILLRVLLDFLVALAALLVGHAVSPFSPR